MASIKSYTTGKGEKRYKFQIYLGRDEQTGKKINTTRRGFKTKKEASVMASKIEYEFATGKSLKKSNNILFKDVYLQWYETYINTVRESTYAKTDGMFQNHILPDFGDKRIRTIKINDIQNSVNSWFKIAPSSFKKWFHYTSMVFEYAIKEGYIENKFRANPCTLVTLPKKENDYGDKKLNFWDKDQLTTFFSLINQETDFEKYVLFRTLAFCGLRKGECLALNWSDINFDNKTLSINKTLTQGKKGKQIIQAPKTKKGMRTIPLDDKTFLSIKKWNLIQKKRFLMLGMTNNNLVFSTVNGTHKSLNTPGKWLDKILRNSNLPRITIHGFRHTHASALFSAGASIKQVQERLGHEDVQTTLNIYTHVTSQQNIEAVNKLSSYLNF